MDFIAEAALRIFPFLAVITIVVFFHELGHFLVARWNGIRVEVFSIGFGGEIFGWRDKYGTRWRISWVPLGGYVKFFGDAGATSAEGDGLDEMTAAERAVSFHHKRLWQRASVVVAGPVANFILAIIVFAVMFATVGQRISDPIVVEVSAGGAAAAAGFEQGDLVATIDGRGISRFQELQAYVQPRPGQDIQIGVIRDGQTVDLIVTPTPTEREVFGSTQTIGLIGITGPGGQFERQSPTTSIWLGVTTTFGVVETTLVYLADVVTGNASSDQLSGPIGIAVVTSEVARASVVGLINLAAVISVALGLFNLFPIPLLDGGHLLFYGAEALRGKPLSDRAQEYGMRFGMLVVIAIFVLATFNDLKYRLDFFGFVSGLFS
ncbi:MAG: RIP metalloprotease RseP [Proteobacteria bacterium]|nr:RIP metalloprotease RseP [Pseudomonadota bacterium]MDA1058575.1 RIP metalloprotease RseP [Pseudomonadota bacterium]